MDILGFFYGSTFDSSLRIDNQQQAKYLTDPFRCFHVRHSKDLVVEGVSHSSQKLRLADLSLGAEVHAEAATALAELYVNLGQPAAALELLHSLQGAGAVLPPQSPAIWPLHWRRASLFLKLGHTVRCLSHLQSPGHFPG